MYDLKACIACLSIDTKLYNMDSGQLRNEFHLITGLQTWNGSGMPDYLCFQCSAYLKSCIKFRDRCQRAHYALQQILNVNKEIKKTNLTDFNRSLFDIMPPLSLMSLEKAHYEQTKFQWTQYNRLSYSSTLRLNATPILHCSTLTAEDTFSTVTNAPIEIEVVNAKIKDDIEQIDQSVVNSEVRAINEDYVGESSSNIEVADAFMDNDDPFVSDAESELLEPNNICKNEKMDGDVDGSNLDEEYAMMIPISVKEAKAVVEVYKLFSHGKFHCKVCNKPYYSEIRLKEHMRMHEKHLSGTFHCELCNYFYKSDYLLKTHMTAKHMYKYVCRKCPDVNYDRTSAKQHYIWAHLPKGCRKEANWYESRPSWLSNKGGTRKKGVVTMKPVRKLTKVPKDFLVCSAIQHEEQYAIVRERQDSRNYKEAKFKCNMCYRGFREMETYSKHMRKHSSEHSGRFECDVCKLHFRDQRKMYKHMKIAHLFKYTCQMCTYVCYSSGQAQMHYRWHKNVKYPCPHCKMEFSKSSTRLTHIRIKHPSTNLCNLCGHSFVSKTGLYCHKNIAHTKEERELSATLSVNKLEPTYCADCNVQFVSEAAFNTHLGSSNKHASTNLSTKPNRRRKSEEEHKPRGRPGRGNRPEIVNNGVTTPTTCEVCNVVLANDVQARKHYESEHPDTEFLKRYMCDVCGHTTRQYANLLVHMRTHTDEKPYECPHCDRRFNMPSNRDRHLVVHTGEKRYQCQHCNRRFSQSSACKLHIQTVHFKIPYAPWNKKNRKRRKQEQENANLAATSNLQTQHKLTFDTQGDYLNAYITYNDE